MKKETSERSKRLVKKIVVGFTEEEKDEIKEVTGEKGMTINAFIRAIVKKELSKLRKTMK
jgi:hypothetical protein